MSNKKYVIVLGDGMADEPIEQLGGKTPLEYAKLILNGDPETYLKTVTEYKPLD